MACVDRALAQQVEQRILVDAGEDGLGGLQRQLLGLETGDDLDEIGPLYVGADLVELKLGSGEPLLGVVDAGAADALFAALGGDVRGARSAEHTSELQYLMRISYAVFCLKK